MKPGAGGHARDELRVHEFLICIIETIGFDDADGGHDTIFGSPCNDILFGGGGNDVIYGFGGNDLIFGDQGKVTCTTQGVRPGRSRQRRLRRPRRHDRLPRDEHAARTPAPATTSIYAGDGRRHRHGPAGRRHHLRRGRRRHPDRRLERLRRARRRRRHRRRHGQRLHRRRQRRVLLPPRLPRPAHAGSHRHRHLRHDASPTAPTATRSSPARLRTTRTTDTQYPHHAARPQRRHPGATDPELWGDDYIAGGAGDDEIFGQLGNDVIQGDGYVERARARHRRASASTR